VPTVDGIRHTVTSADGVRIGLLTAGTGPKLLLVHGGMGSIESWAPVWDALTRRRRVTAMDRRGRGTSGDAAGYTLEREFADVAAVAAALAEENGGPVDVAAHSIGATCVLGGAARGAPFRRIAAYEPPGPATVAGDWPARMTALIDDGQVGRAVVGFLTEIIGLTPEEIAAARDTPAARDALTVAAATLPREARALAAVDLPAIARQVRPPVLLLLGETSPAWAGLVSGELAAALPDATVARLPRVGHDALGGAPGPLTAAIESFLDRP
jgi:pimeloyl-ACP methyl ester carboxylesterase